MRVAIANRGEVALRIVRACRELGYTTLLLHSEADRLTSAYRLADEVVELKGESLADTYLNIPKVVQAAKRKRADLLHPGFGFLSENSAFASALGDAGITFIGPRPETMELLGDKTKAKALAKKLGIPTLPAFFEPEASLAELQQAASSIGYPLLIKAAAGGGGKGMKLVNRASEFIAKLEAAKREAKSSFGDDAIYLEKYLKQPRHIEVQIIADSRGNTLHLFERECSLQRRYQKIIEESPSPALTKGKLRDKLTQAAIKLAKKAKYLNAGTIEFLIDAKNNFYFLECNTRLQVEHPVTEMVCGVDLVKWQLKIATGGKLPLKQTDIKLRGHAMETRVYAEDASNQFLPSIGELGLIDLPMAPHCRFDFGVESGDAVTPLYDPMIGKIITWAESREENIGRMQAALANTVIFGVDTNIEFLKSILSHKRFIKGQLSTHFIDETYKQGFKPVKLSKAQKLFLDKSASKKLTRAKQAGLSYQSPWQTT